MMMRQFSERAGSHIDDGRVYFSRLDSVPETVPIAAVLRVVHEELISANSAHVAAELETTTRRNIRSDKRRAVVNRVRDLRQVVYAACNHNHRSDLVSEVLPRGISPMTGGPQEVRNLQWQMLRDRALSCGNEAVATQAGTLADSLTELDGATRDYHKAIGTESVCCGKVRIAKRNWLAAVQHAYYQVRDLYPHDRSRAEWFFPPVRTRSEKGPAEPAAPAPADAPAPAPSPAPTSTGNPALDRAIGEMT